MAYVASQFFGGVRDPGSMRCRLREEEDVREGVFFRFGVAIVAVAFAFAIAFGLFVLLSDSDFVDAFTFLDTLRLRFGVEITF